MSQRTIPIVRTLHGVLRCGLRSCPKRTQFHRYASTSASVDEAEVQRFTELSNSWADEDGPFKALHSLNKLRVPWIIENLGAKENTKGLHVCDVGCGGGLLSTPLARCGLRVTGIDATEAAIDAANKALSTRALQVNEVAKRIAYTCSTVEDFVLSHENNFDAVVASEILEHVNDLEGFVMSCVRLAKPGAPIFFTTINKTIASKLMAIWLAEEVLQIVPRGVHEWEKFVKPEDLSSILQSQGCTVRSLQGFTYHPLGNWWQWVDWTDVNYALIATKN